MNIYLQRNISNFYMSTKSLLELVRILIKESLEDTAIEQQDMQELPKDVDLTPEKNSVLPDFKSTNEQEILPFAAKYSMLNISPDRFIMDMVYLFAKMMKEGKSVDEIKNLLLPADSSGVHDFTTFIQKAEEMIRSHGGEPVVGAQMPEEVKKYGKEAYKRYFPKDREDPKSQISYEFTKGRLTPRGYWQLQFLSRILAGKPLNAEEEVFFNGPDRDKYMEIAYYTLRDFYKHAFMKMAVQLAGRFHKTKELTNKDVWLQTDIDSAVDNFLDTVRGGQYDVNQNNIGAWAFTTMRNKLIDFIKGLTTIKYRTGIDAKTGIHTYDAFVQNNLKTWYSTLAPNKADIDPEDLSEPVQKVKLNTGEVAYQYNFTSPEVAHSYLQTAEQGEVNNIFKHLTKGGQRRLANMGSKLGIRKYAQYYPDTQTEPEIAGEKEKLEKGMNILEHNLFTQLFDFAYKSTDSFDSAFGEKSVFNGDNLVDLPRSQARAFKADIGNALFKFLGYFDYTNVWKKKARGKFDPELYAQLAANPNDAETIEAYKDKFKAEENEAMYYALLGLQKGKDWTKLNNVAVNKRAENGEYVGIVDPNYIDENGDIYEELLPFVKSAITRSRKGLVTKELESEINADRASKNKAPFNNGQLQAISSAAKQMEDIIKTNPKLADLIKRILKGRQIKNQTINEMKDSEQLRSLIQKMLKEAINEDTYGHDDAYEMPDFDETEEDDSDVDQDQEDDIMDITPEKKAPIQNQHGMAVKDMLSMDNPQSVAMSLAAAEKSMYPSIATELNKMKITDEKKLVPIIDSLVSMYQQGNKSGAVYELLANYYDAGRRPEFIVPGNKNKGSVYNILRKDFGTIDRDIISDSIYDAFMALIKGYKPQGASFDGYIYRVARNAINKQLGIKDPTTSLDAPLSDKGGRTKGDTIGSEDGDNDGGAEDAGDETDQFGADEEGAEENLNMPSALEKVLGGTREDIVAFKKALTDEAAKFPKWKRYLKAFENVWQKGHSWTQELGNTANWKDYGVLETGKKLLIDYFIEPALKGSPVQEVKVTKTREGEAWAPFDVTKSGAVQGIKDPQAFANIKAKIATLGDENLNKIMDFLENSEKTNLNVAELGDAAKLMRIVTDLKAPIIHQLRELGKKTNIEIKKPVSAVRKLKRSVDRGSISGNMLDKLTNIGDDELQEEEVHEAAVIDSGIDPAEMQDFLATFQQHKATAGPINETYNTMHRLLNGNKLTK